MAQIFKQFWGKEEILWHDGRPMNQEPKIKVVVVGASGYTGQELLRLLIMHPLVDLVGITSRQESGRPIGELYPRFSGAPGIENLRFMDPDIDAIVETGATCAFLALPHGVAYEFAGALLDRGLKVIDLSADFRLRSADVYREFYEHEHPAPELLKDAVFGLPEIYRDEISSASLVASPGCYPTSILIPLIPLVKAGLVNPDTITVSSVSGASGAGKKADTSLLFTEVNESVRAYGAPKHRHLSEIEQELSNAAGREVVISFVPHLMPVNCGIATTIFAELSVAPDKAGGMVDRELRDFYKDACFVRILGENAFADTKNVTRTNFVDVGWVVDPRTKRLIVSSAEDNLGKGAGGQAIQSFNVMNSLPEDIGLRNY